MENQPIDPSKAYIEVEREKQNVAKLKIVSESQQKAEELRFKALETAEQLDIKRDEMIMHRNIELRKISQKEDEVDAKIVKEQTANEKLSTGAAKGSKKSS